jgi:hypothetical protein
MSKDGRRFSISTSSDNFPSLTTVLAAANNTRDYYGSDSHLLTRQHSLVPIKGEPEGTSDGEEVNNNGQRDQEPEDNVRNPPPPVIMQTVLMRIYQVNKY